MKRRVVQISGSVPEYLIDFESDLSIKALIKRRVGENDWAVIEKTTGALLAKTGSGNYHSYCPFDENITWTAVETESRFFGAVEESRFGPMTVLIDFKGGLNVFFFQKKNSRHQKKIVRWSPNRKCLNSKKSPEPDYEDDERTSDTLDQIYNANADEFLPANETNSDAAPGDVSNLESIILEARKNCKALENRHIHSLFRTFIRPQPGLEIPAMSKGRLFL